MGKTTKDFPKELRTPLTVSGKDRQAAYMRIVGELMSKPEGSPITEEPFLVIEAYEKSVDEKIEALARHYGQTSPISCDQGEIIESYRNLLVALAADFVPAFRDDQKGGRPADKWDRHMRWLLVADMERRVTESGSNRGISYAAALLAKKPWWQALIGKKDDAGESSTADAIRAAYNSARKKMTDPDRLFGNLHNEKSPADWDEYVKDQVLMKVCKLECGENWEAVFFRIMGDKTLK